MLDLHPTGVILYLHLMGVIANIVLQGEIWKTKQK